MRKNKGITLISLVVTVAILLILVGVVVYNITGDRGIIRNARNAKKTNQNEESEFVDDMKDIYDKWEKADNNEIPASWIGKVEKIKYGVPIPYGYYYMGGTKDTGLVISDNINDENATNYTAQDGLKGNQWVWVPVENASTMYEDVNPAIAITGGSGKTFISGVNTGRYSKSGIISGVTRGLPNSTSPREPDVVVGTNGTSFDAAEINYKEAGFSSLENMAKTMVEEYNVMTQSIEKYKGFYIGRYELTENGEKVGVALTNSKWYTIYSKCKELEANDKVQTRMLWSCQWDITCGWLANSGYNIKDSRSWGNYNNSIGDAAVVVDGTKKYGSKQNTGYSEYWKSNNIYDLAGNCAEWTQEATSSSNRLARGNYAGDDGYSRPVTYSFAGSGLDDNSNPNKRLSCYTLYKTLICGSIKLRDNKIK